MVVLLCSMCFASAGGRVPFPRSTINAAGELSIPVVQRGRTLAKCQDLESLLVTHSEHAFQFLVQAFVQKRVVPPGAPLVTQPVGHMCNHVVIGRENVEDLDEHHVAGPPVVQFQGNLERDVRGMLPKKFHIINDTLGAFDRTLRDIIAQHRCVLLGSAHGEERKAVRFHGLRPQSERITRPQHIQVQLGHARDCLTAPSFVPRKQFAAQRRHADFDHFPLGRLESAPYASREQVPHRVPDHALHRSQTNDAAWSDSELWIQNRRTMNAQSAIAEPPPDDAGGKVRNVVKTRDVGWRRVRLPLVVAQVWKDRRVLLLRDVHPNLASDQSRVCCVAV